MPAERAVRPPARGPDPQQQDPQFEGATAAGGRARPDTASVCVRLVPGGDRLSGGRQGGGVEPVVRRGDSAGGGTLCGLSTRAGGVMKAVRWEDTKRRIREIDPDWDSPERVAARDRSREELRAEQRGYQLAQLRKSASPRRRS